MDNIQPLLPSSVIASRVAELGTLITKQYTANSVDELVVVCVMKGAFLFFADIVRNINLPNVRCEFINVSSYEGEESTGQIKLNYDLDVSAICDKHVLIVEDIYDSGRTLKFLVEHLKSKCPKSVKICCLLEKKDKALFNVDIDYVGFEVDKDAFVVGYGLDLDGIFRNLPYIGIYHTSRQ